MADGMDHRAYDVATGKAAGYKEFFTTLEEWIETMEHREEKETPPQKGLKGPY